MTDKHLQLGDQAGIMKCLFTLEKRTKICLTLGSRLDSNSKLDWTLHAKLYLP